MIRKLTLAIFATAFASVAGADGFAIRDLTKATDVTSVLGAGYVSRVEPDRTSFFCTECAGLPMIDVLIGRQTDGTEGRLRSGETTIADMQALCQARDPACTIEAVIVDPAVGYISSYRLGANFGHTMIIFRDGDLLTIRSISGDADTARRNARTLEISLVPEIVGK